MSQLTTVDRDALQEQIDKGRGLWIGLFVPPDVAGPSKHPLVSWMKEDAHVTLVHLGKKTDRRAEDVLDAAWKVAQYHAFPMQAEITGVGLFWRTKTQTLVALVNSAQVCALRESLLRQLLASGQYRDDRYGFIPHVTLRDGHPVEMLTEPYSSTSINSEKYMHSASGITFKFSSLVVVCGDVRVEVS